jgi:elongation factor Ts
MSSVETIKALREKTGAGIVDCKVALQNANGDLEQAIDFLRQKGSAQAGKKADRETREGIIYSYIHSGGKIGVLMEVNCETDFVARNPEFQGFVRDIALHIAGSVPPPRCVRKEELPSDAPADEVCLLAMPFIRDPSVTIADLVTQAIAKIGENIKIRRFTRYQLGEG